MHASAFGASNSSRCPVGVHGTDDGDMVGEVSVQPQMKLGDCLRQCGQAGAPDASLCGYASAEVLFMWPPVATLGQSCTVEARVCRSTQVACCVSNAEEGGPAAEGAHNSSASGGPTAPNLSAAAHADVTTTTGVILAPWGPINQQQAHQSTASYSDSDPSAAATSSPCCAFSPTPATLLALHQDTVLSAEPFTLPAASTQATTVRCRVLAHDVTCVGLLVGCKPGGWPTLDALKASSLLPVLPGPVREELQSLIWSMMCEALPPGVTKPPYDSSSFQGPFTSLDARMQEAYIWAWGTHFKPLAADLNYCLECLPVEGSFTEVDYRYVLASLVSYLRDHDCWVCLACLLAAATARGVVLLSAPGGDVLGAGDLSPDQMLQAAQDGMLQYEGSTCGTSCDDTCSSLLSSQSSIDPNDFVWEQQSLAGCDGATATTAEEAAATAAASTGPAAAAEAQQALAVALAGRLQDLVGEAVSSWDDDEECPDSAASMAMVHTNGAMQMHSPTYAHASSGSGSDSACMGSPPHAATEIAMGHVPAAPAAMRVHAAHAPMLAWRMPRALASLSLLMGCVSVVGLVQHVVACSWVQPTGMYVAESAGMAAGSSTQESVASAAGQPDSAGSLFISSVAAMVMGCMALCQLPCAAAMWLWGALRCMAVWSRGGAASMATALLLLAPVLACAMRMGAWRHAGLAHGGVHTTACGCGCGGMGGGGVSRSLTK